MNVWIPNTTTRFGRIRKKKIVIHHDIENRRAPKARMDPRSAVPFEAIIYMLLFLPSLFVVVRPCERDGSYWPKGSLITSLTMKHSLYYSPKWERHSDPQNAKSFIT
jgi:hypothetical protein